MTLFIYFGKGWSLCCLRASLGLSWTWVVSDQMLALSPFARNAVAPMCRVIFLCFPMRRFHCWMESVVRPDVCPQFLLVVQWPQTTGFSFYPASVVFLLMDGVGCQFRCVHQPILGATVKMVFVLIFLLPQQESLWSGPSRACGVSKLCRKCSCWFSQVSWYLAWVDMGGIEMVPANTFVLREVFWISMLLQHKFWD